MEDERLAAPGDFGDFGDFGDVEEGKGASAKTEGGKGSFVKESKGAAFSRGKTSKGDPAAHPAAAAPPSAPMAVSSAEEARIQQLEVMMLTMVRREQELALALAESQVRRQPFGLPRPSRQLPCRGASLTFSCPGRLRPWGWMMRSTACAVSTPRRRSATERRRPVGRALRTEGGFFLSVALGRLLPGGWRWFGVGWL